MAINENNNVPDTSGQAQNTVSSQMQQNTTASQNMYSTQQTQNYTYGADAQERMMQMHRIAHTIMRIIRMHITTMHRQIRITQTTIHRQHSSRLVQIIIIMTTRFPGMFLMRYL